MEKTRKIINIAIEKLAKTGLLLDLLLVLLVALNLTG